MGTQTEWVEANGRPGVLISTDGTPMALLTVSASADGIHQIRWLMNPTKLAAFSRSAHRPA